MCRDAARCVPIFLPPIPSRRCALRGICNPALAALLGFAIRENNADAARRVPTFNWQLLFQKKNATFVVKKMLHDVIIREKYVGFLGCIGCGVCRTLWHFAAGGIQLHPALQGG